MPVSHPPRGPYIKGSITGAGEKRPLDAFQRRRFNARLAAHVRARHLTRCYRDVGEALTLRLGLDGQCDPSHQTLADDTGCSLRTVARALEALRWLGLVEWDNRIVRDGWQAQQTSNQYRLIPDGQPLPGYEDMRAGRRERRRERDAEIVICEVRLVPSHDCQRGEQNHQTPNPTLLSTSCARELAAPGPSSGSDEWGFWNRDRQLADLTAG